MVVWLLRCAAFHVLNLFFFSCNIEAGAPDKQERICPDVVRAGVTAVVVVCLIVVFGALFGVFFFLHFHPAPSKWATRSGIQLCTNACFTSGLCRHSLLGFMTC